MPYWDAPQLTLACWPSVPEHIAKPWDAADEYLWHSCDRTAPTLLINDRYGALQCAFPQAFSWQDSQAADQARQQNLARNQLDAPAAFFSPSLPQVRQVLIKVPKNLELLHYWLAQCQAQLPADTHYYLAGMAKHWPISWLKWLEEHSQYQQYPLVKKARLVRLSAITVPSPALWRGYSYQELQFSALPGVFCRDKLDLGSAVLLAAKLPFAGDLCDLGCGNGLLGLTLANRHSLSSLTLCDDSYLALSSAQHNAEVAQISAHCVHSNILENVQGPFDWIVCNPPFHDGHKELTNIALAMFEQSKEKLKANGKLLVIANRHLPYFSALKKEFKKVASIADDARFSLYCCQN